MVWLPDGGKKFEDIFIRFDATHERDRQTDKQMDGHRMPTYTAFMHMHRAVKKSVWGGHCRTLPERWKLK